MMMAKSIFSDIIRLNNLIFQVICRFRHLNSNISISSVLYFIYIEIFFAKKISEVANITATRSTFNQLQAGHVLRQTQAHRRAADGQKAHGAIWTD